MWEALREQHVCVLRPWEWKRREVNGQHLREKLTLCTDHSSVDSRIRNSLHVWRTNVRHEGIRHVGVHP